MNRFLKHWRLSGCGEAFRAHVVSYADDFVILSRGRAAEALAWTAEVMMRLGLTINEAKTSLKNARQERFDFLGYSFGPHWFKSNGKSLNRDRFPLREIVSSPATDGGQGARGAYANVVAWYIDLAGRVTPGANELQLFAHQLVDKTVQLLFRKVPHIIPSCAERDDNDLRD